MQLFHLTRISNISDSNLSLSQKTQIDNVKPLVGSEVLQDLAERMYEN